MSATSGGLLRAGFVAYFTLVVGFLVLPLLIVVPISFNDDQWLRFPPETLSLRWYKKFIFDERFVQATITSLWIATVVAIIATALGTVTAIGMTRTEFPGKRLLYGLIVAPMIIPIIIYALALFILFSRVQLTGNVFGLIAAHVVLALPFPVLIISAALQQFDITLERAGRVLGANSLQVFFHITVPHVRSSILASSIFAFFVSFDELVVALFITGRWDTLPKRIWSDLRLEIDPTIAAVASLLIGITILGISLGEMLRKRAMRRVASDI